MCSICERVGKRRGYVIVRLQVQLGYIYWLLRFESNRAGFRFESDMARFRHLGLEGLLRFELDRAAGVE